MHDSSPADLLSDQPAPELFALTLAGIRKAGGAEKYLRGKVDLARLRRLLNPTTVPEGPRDTTGRPM